MSNFFSKAWQDIEAVGKAAISIVGTTNPAVGAGLAAVSTVLASQPTGQTLLQTIENDVLLGVEALLSKAELPGLTAAENALLDSAALASAQFLVSVAQRKLGIVIPEATPTAATGGSFTPTT